MGYLSEEVHGWPGGALEVFSWKSKALTCENSRRVDAGVVIMDNLDF